MRKPISLIVVPFHMGLERVAVGAGPDWLLSMGADKLLGRKGMPAPVEHIRMRDANCRDMDAVVDVNRQIRSAVRRAVREDSLPVVLAGNCNTCLGTLAGLEPAHTGIVWLDRHGDFNTPETTASGSLEGMSLAIAVGDCHEDLRGRIGFGTPIAERDVCLFGARDLDPHEEPRLRRSAISDNYPTEVEAVYLHIDIDYILGPEAPSASHAATIVRTVATELPLAAVNLTNYRPDLDEDGQTAQAALLLLSSLVA